MKNIKILLRELLLIPLSAIVGGVVGLFLGMNYGGNYGFESILGPGYEGAGLMGLLLGAAVLVGTRVYFWLQRLKISSFAITVGSFLVSSVIADRLFYLGLTHLPSKALSLATIILILLLGLLIPTYIFRTKMKGKK